MGDMADYINEQDCYADEFDDGVECKYCGNGPFYWESTATGWRLHTETGRLHTCKAHPVNKKVNA